MRRTALTIAAALLAAGLGPVAAARPTSTRPVAAVSKTGAKKAATKKAAKAAAKAAAKRARTSARTPQARRCPLSRPRHSHDSLSSRSTASCSSWDRVLSPCCAVMK